MATPLPRKQPVEPELDPSAQEQLERSRDALDNMAEGFDDENADATPDLPSSVSGGPRPRKRAG